MDKQDFSQERHDALNEMVHELEGTIFMEEAYAAPHVHKAQAAKEKLKAVKSELETMKSLGYPLNEKDVVAVLKVYKIPGQKVPFHVESTVLGRENSGTGTDIIQALKNSLSFWWRHEAGMPLDD